MLFFVFSASFVKFVFSIKNILPNGHLSNGLKDNTKPTESTKKKRKEKEETKNLEVSKPGISGRTRYNLRSNVTGQNDLTTRGSQNEPVKKPREVYRRKKNDSRKPKYALKPKKEKEILNKIFKFTHKQARMMPAKYIQSVDLLNLGKLCYELAIKNVNQILENPETNIKFRDSNN
ncbi:hypothetical protein EDEG_03194 [Edhazardia aedis USNM 41457]|uniref:Uncharacterized protein n=1 Tax=Edhazardia aedis (strain USNM 41457) TaxID=1003232 RepID=J9D4A0_EDHAE|nr:hypothetical protein EDEG_03194 [Edhazardia aedis USNM 41457]|eukprot:EJW02379.1 hypothetical protein EDEG_03194 [Edhazardia aedis USNM 41457]